jgi:hypothetical protein
VTKLFNGRPKPCDDYACECRVTAQCPKGQAVSSCLCSNSNPLTPVDLGQPAYPDPATANAAGSAALAQGYGRQPELDLRYPWVLTSNFNPMQMDGAGLNRVTECSCTWVNTIPLVSDG